MSADALTPLIERLARARGIGDAYHSYKGELKHFSLATKAAILRAMHCRLDDAAALEAQIRESEAAHPAGLLGDVVVLRNGARAARVNTPAIEQNALAALDGGARGRRRTRVGEVRAWDLPERGSHQQDGKWFVLRDLSLPADLPPGYHRLDIDLEYAGREELCAHRDARQMPRTRRRSPRARGSGAWPCSSTRCARRTTGASATSRISTELLRHAAAAGADFVGISPVHALFPSDPTLYSPYSRVEPACAERDVHRRGGGARSAGLAPRAGHHGGSRLSCAPRRRCARPRRWTTPAVASLKMPVLQAAFERFRTEHLARHTARAAACRAFLRERGEAMRLHTLFDAIDGYLRRHHGTGAGWHNWPEEYRHPDGDAVRRFARDARRRGGFPRLPAVARGRAVRRGAAAGARAVA